MAIDITKFTQYFGGKYIKFWYGACFVIFILMAFSIYNNDAVSKFELTIYNADGTVKSQEVVDKVFVARELGNLPIEKEFVPIKPF